MAVTWHKLAQVRLLQPQVSVCQSLVHTNSSSLKVTSLEVRPAQEEVSSKVRPAQLVPVLSTSLNILLLETSRGQYRAFRSFMQSLSPTPSVITLYQEAGDLLRG